MELSRLLVHGEVLLERGERGYVDDEAAVVVKATAKKRRRRRPTLRQLWDKNQREADSSRVLNLTLDVNGLRQQVHNCLVQKSLWETRRLVARQQFHARSLQSVDHFFQLFGQGYPAALSANEEKFLSVLVDENIAVGDGVRGRAAFYEQWRRYKHVFSVRRLSNFSAQVITSDDRGCLVECSGEFEGRVTAAALETVFPSALEDEALTERVLHRRFVCPTRTLISLDSNGSLVQYDAESNVFKAMSELLDFNPNQVAKIMTDAMISEGSLIPPVDDSASEAEQNKKRRKSRLSAQDKTQREAEILNLTLDVNSLRQQVHDCLVQKSLWETRLLIAREQFHARSLRSVGHFFHLFQSGYPKVLPVSEKRFLAALLDESISVGGGVRGQVQFLEQWRRYKKLFSVRRLSTHSMQVVSTDSAGCLIECIGAFEGCVTVAALQSVFPYALEDKALVDLVQHRRFVCPAKTLITLDASGRVVQFDANSDVFKTMSQVLDFDLHRLAMVMKNDVISLLPPVARIAGGSDDEYYLDACRGEPVCDSADRSPAKNSSRNSIEFLLS